MPDKAIEIMDEAAAKVNVMRGTAHEHAAAILNLASKTILETNKKQAIVGVQQVKEVVAQWVGMKVKDIH